ncbi:unnamed protein product [Euphydryas editha]|uniref:SCP domain-containing protein n=1 Tax=Euphydryas editha TaxID=104508 RepID=A0AAU9V4J4_EUPED|nr:unnamed protein product [Euphydryas editha]
MVSNHSKFHLNSFSSLAGCANDRRRPGTSLAPSANRYDGALSQPDPTKLFNGKYLSIPNITSDALFQSANRWADYLYINRCPVRYNDRQRFCAGNVHQCGAVNRDTGSNQPRLRNLPDQHNKANPTDEKKKKKKN